MEGNQSRPMVFILLGFGNLHELRYAIFTLFLIIYFLSILGNLLIVFLVAVEQHLHTPMYFFLMNLSSLETCYISTILPRMLASFLSWDQSISIQACFTQCYFFAFLATTECYLLTMMSYDRYLAICKPLHYTSIMNGRICFHLAFVSWTTGLLTSTIIMGFLSKLDFCGPNIIDHFFCDINPVINLSCSKGQQAKLVTFIFGCIGSGPQFLLTVTSYIFIIHTILGIKSRNAQQKAFSTCSSHLIVVVIFYGSLIVVYVVPETETLKPFHKTFSLFYTVLTPILNPLIYSLRNREVKTALFRSFRKLSSIVS